MKKKKYKKMVKAMRERELYNAIGIDPNTNQIKGLNESNCREKRIIVFFFFGLIALFFVHIHLVALGIFPVDIPSSVQEDFHKSMIFGCLIGDLIGVFLLVKVYLHERNFDNVYRNKRLIINKLLH